MANDTFKKLIREFYKESAKASILEMFSAETFDDIDDNINSIAEKYSEKAAEDSEQLIDIIDKLIDYKINNAKVIHTLANSGGNVAGEITLKSIK